MKALTTAGLTKLIQLIKSSFISNTDTVTTNTVTLAEVATSGDFDDLINQPTIGNGTITFTQGGVTKGTITTNQSGNATIVFDAGGGGTATDVQINGTSITSNNVADIITEGVYNATTNKIATIADIPSIPMVDQTYDGTSINAQSGVAIEGELTNYQDKLVSGTNIKTINNQSLLGSGNINLDSLPSQTGQSGKFLTTNGSVASWSDTTKVTFRDWSVT